MDHISHLPQSILHEILSRLPEKDAARTIVLSKAWAETWYTFPILYFNGSKIIGTYPRRKKGFLRKRKKFIDYVNKTLLRFHDQGLAIKELKLNCLGVQCMSHDIDRWLKLAREIGVEALELCLPNGFEQDEFSQDQCYFLPYGVLEVESLNKLVLMGGIKVDQALLLNHSIKFFSLRVLSLLFFILEDENVIKHLISRCPLIEYITLKGCSVMNHVCEGSPTEAGTSWLKSLSMVGLQKLKVVDVQEIQEVYVDAPSVEKFCYGPGDLDGPCKMNFNGCKNLRELYLWGIKSTIFTDKWFLELFPKFPFLESLKLDRCTISKRINILSVQLKVLKLSYCCSLEEVSIDAPNLLSCEYYGYGATKPIIYFHRSSSQLEVKATININYLELCNLREFIQNFKPQNVLSSLSLVINQPFTDELHPVLLQVSSPPPSIKHLDISTIPENEIFYLPLVNSFLSSCRPTTISLSWYCYFSNRAFIEFFYETLTRRKEDDCYCSSSDTRCWWHALKDVKVTTSTNTDENVNFRTMIDALPTFLPLETIMFKLEL